MRRPVLSTARIRLKPMTSEHLPLLVQLDADAEVLRYIPGRARTEQERGTTERPSILMPTPMQLGLPGGWDEGPVMATSSAGGTSRQHGPHLGCRLGPRRDGGSLVGTGGRATPPRELGLSWTTASPALGWTRSGRRRWRSTKRAAASWSSSSCVTCAPITARGTNRCPVLNAR